MPPLPTNAASLVTLYGRGAVNFDDGRRSYSPKNGVLQVPPHLVQRAMACGFSRTLPADMQPVVTAEVMEDIEIPPATMLVDVPVEHPAAEERAAVAVDDAKRHERIAAAQAREEEQAARQTQAGRGRK